MTRTTSMRTDSMYCSLSPADDNAPLPSLSEVGGKALSLMECSKAGFAVPPGFCLSVNFFDPWMRNFQALRDWKQFLNDPTSKESCDELKNKCRDLQLDSEQQKQLNAALNETLGDDENTAALVAVRSSSPEEDLAKASFAGGYETALGVPWRDFNALLRAIRTCFASCLDYRVVQYKLQQDLDITKPCIAVVVQAQIASAVSGVGFSLNSQNNAYDEAVISSNFGLGETVVSGVVTPDTFVVDKIKMEILSKTISEKTHALKLQKDGGTKQEPIADAIQPSLSDKQVLEVATLLKNVEAFMERPVDIEWAIDDSDDLYLLQARPITTYLSLFEEMVTAPGEQKLLYMDLVVLTQGFSDPMSVLALDIWGEFLLTAKKIPHGPDGLFWELHGREYLHLSNLLACAGGETLVRKAFPSAQRILEAVDLKEYKPDYVTEKNKWILWDQLKLFSSLLPSMIRGMWDWNKAVDAYVAKWQEIFERFKEGGTEESREEGLTYQEEVDNATSVMEELTPLFGGLIMSIYAKWRIYKLFDGDSEVQDLLVTLNMDLDGNPTSEMGHGMVILASFPEIQETENADEFVQRLTNKSYSDNFLMAYDDFMAKFGCRCMKEIDIATKRSYEDPGDFFRSIKLIDVESNQILTVKKRKEEAYATLLELATKAGKESKFQYYANIIQKTGGYREHGKYVIVFLTAYLRRRALKLAEQFVQDGRLEDVNDIFSLHVEEVTKAERSPELDLKPVIRANMAPYAAVADITDWPKVIDSRGKIIRAPREDVEDGLGGFPISPGTVRGKAKVLRSPYEKPLEAGEILVAKATEPSWTPIFINAAGVVLEIGGPLQHGAIIAREYGIPCVSGVESAMTDIHDGDLVEVDGTNGIVKILDE